MLKQTGSGEDRAFDDKSDSRFRDAATAAEAATSVVLLFDSEGCSRLTEDVVVDRWRPVVAEMQLHKFVSCDEEAAVAVEEESCGKGGFRFAIFGGSFSFSSSEHEDCTADISE